jgi:hypothetical protein
VVAAVVSYPPRRERRFGRGRVRLHPVYGRALHAGHLRDLSDASRPLARSKLERPPARSCADMKLIAEYVERAEHFEKLADGEADVVLKEELLRQAAAYRNLAGKRAALLSTKPP